MVESENRHWILKTSGGGLETGRKKAAIYKINNNKFHPVKGLFQIHV